MKLGMTRTLAPVPVSVVKVDKDDGFRSYPPNKETDITIPAGTEVNVVKILSVGEFSFATFEVNVDGVCYGNLLLLPSPPPLLYFSGRYLEDND